MAEKTIKFAIENNVDKMLVINNSDTIQGMLRISDVKLNDIPVVESVVEVSQLLAKFLNKLSFSFLSLPFLVTNLQYFQ